MKSQSDLRNFSLNPPSDLPRAEGLFFSQRAHQILGRKRAGHASFSTPSASVEVMQNTFESDSASEFTGPPAFLNSALLLVDNMT